MRADGPRRYAVTQRAHEIGIRMALVAPRSDVMGLVLGQSLTPLDPTTFVGASLTFAAVAMIAAFVPARRATKVHPLVALRCG